MLLIALLVQTGVLYEKHSQFNNIIVRETPQRRELVFDNVTQSAMRPGKPRELVLEYTKAAMVGLCFAEPKRVLVLGLGGASMPNFFMASYPGARVDSVEIDPDVVDVARAFFEFHTHESNRVFVLDGAEFIKTATDQYDLIFLDTYAPDFIPKALSTREFFAKVKARLAPKGVLVSNVWGPPSPGYQPMITEQRAVFSDFYVVRALNSGNHIFVASATQRGMTKADLLACTDRLKLPFDLRAIVQSGFDSQGDARR